MLSIGGDDLAKSTIFRYWGDDLAKLTRLQMSNFLPKIKRRPKQRSSRSLLLSFGTWKYWGGCCRIIGRDTSLYGFAPMVMKRFEIIEKLYLSKALLKVAGRGDASPTSPPGSAPARNNKGNPKSTAHEMFKWSGNDNCAFKCFWISETEKWWIQSRWQSSRLRRAKVWN